MNNITWGKTIANWGSNNPNFDPTKTMDEQKGRIEITFDDKILALNELQQRYQELIILTSELYKGGFSNKELHDSYITLLSAKKSLDDIYIQKPVEETIKESK
jgi:hypothetical protein